jgi:CheY-like chemotaxis protein
MKALRVLLIEDNALIAVLLAEQLAEMGHDVCATAATEADAVTAASRYKPDLMIVDAGLGGGSGVSANTARGAGRPRIHDRGCWKGSGAQTGCSRDPKTVS